MTDVRGKATVARLLSATLGCLAREGYARLNIEAITIEAGMTRGALFHHFETKADLIARAAALFLRTRHDRLQTLADQPDMARADLGARLELLRREVARDHILYVEIANALRSDKELSDKVQALDVPSLADETALYARLLPEAARDADGGAFIGLVMTFLHGLAAQGADLGPASGAAHESDRADKIFGSFADMFTEHVLRR
ncbi:MAG: TetR/AcrR family transcriptional regulator [Sphingomonadales bacterium]|nr:TetR/AcrR family transcriptional regulator [Sphingomonadales bacterium]